MFSRFASILIFSIYSAKNLRDYEVDFWVFLKKKGVNLKKEIVRKRKKKPIKNVTSLILSLIIFH